MLLTSTDDRLRRGQLELVELRVHDTGIGIDPKHQRRIFEPFWQADQRLTRTVGGAGLGLAIVRRFTHLLGGEVTVASTRGRGTTFTIHLPQSTA